MKLCLVWNLLKQLTKLLKLYYNTTLQGNLPLLTLYILQILYIWRILWLQKQM